MTQGKSAAFLLQLLFVLQIAQLSFAPLILTITYVLAKRFISFNRPIYFDSHFSYFFITSLCGITFPSPACLSPLLIDSCAASSTPTHQSFSSFANVFITLNTTSFWWVLRCPKY